MYVELRNINKYYGDFKASDNVSFGIEQGKLVALLGPSGSGKTTILRMIAGLEHPDDGEILIDGKVVNNIPASQRGIGFVFQSYALFRYMTVYENVAFGLELQKAPKEEIKKRVLELIELVGLKGMEKRYPNQLSGGQRQRVAFARALAPNPKLLLLDEPFAAIDAKVRQELRSWLKNTIEKLGITSIFVTHDQDEAIEVADEIIITNKGRIEHPNYNAFRTFEQRENIDKAFVRPEFVKVTKKSEVQVYKNSAVEGTVEQIFFRGDTLELLINVNNTLITARRGLDEELVGIGEKVDVFIYRIFVTEGEKAYLLPNLAIREESVVI